MGLVVLNLIQVLSAQQIVVDFNRHRALQGFVELPKGQRIGQGVVIACVRAKLGLAINTDRVDVEVDGDVVRVHSSFPL